MNAKIFIVEDEKSIITLIKYNLEKEGYKVSSSENGEEALKEIKVSAPERVVLEWILPNFSGIEM